MPKKSVLLFMLLSIVSLSTVSAENLQSIKADTSLGSNVQLQDTTYHITGGTAFDKDNLFHSFESFNLKAGENAIFDDDGFTNNISRVTGNQHSWINGKISSFANNLYLINPNGLIFGPNASLDVAGSFYATTADYLTLNGDEKFYSKLSDHSILSSASPVEFGFYDDNISSISIQGRGLITEQEWNDNPTGLHVTSGHSISLIGGDIDITDGTKYVEEIIYPDEEPQYRDVDGIEIKAPDGRINMVSVKSQGTVKITEDDIVTTSSMGNINVTDSFIDISGEGGGSLYLRGGQFVMKNSCIQSITDGNTDPGVISIEADDINIHDGSYLVSMTYGLGKGADISLEAVNMISLMGESDKKRFDSENYGSGILTYSGKLSLKNETLGNAGDVYLDASDIYFTDGVFVASKAFGTGTSGNIYCNSANSFRIDGADQHDNWSKLFLLTIGNIDNAGASGTLNITADHVDLTDGAVLTSMTYGSGNSGNINIETKHNVNIDGLALNGRGVQFLLLSMGSGNGGSLNINAGGSIFFKDGSQITASAFREGNSGNISLIANDLIRLSGFNKEKRCTKFTANSVPEIVNGGSAGTIKIKSDYLEMKDGAKFDVCAYGAGSGGYINVDVNEDITISGADGIGWASGFFSGSYPQLTHIPGGSGGKIDIHSRNLYLYDGAQINVGSIAPENMIAKNGGIINLDIDNNLVLSGVNPYGENKDGFGSGIFARSFGKKAGEPGEIIIKTGNLTISDGAVIESTINSSVSGKSIDIEVNNSTIISGDSSKVELKEPCFSQKSYLMEFSPVKYNHSISGIFASTKSPEPDAGNAGSINLITKNLSLFNGASISTATFGIGKAGEINVDADFLFIDNHSSISSESLYLNAYKVSSKTELNNTLLSMGDVVVVSDMSEGKAGSYINTGNNLIKLSNLFQLSDISELDSLESKYVLTGNEMAIVTKNDEQLRFISLNTSFIGGPDKIEWFQMTDKHIYFETIQELDAVKHAWMNNLPYETGDIITVKNASDNLATNFVMYKIQHPIYTSYYYGFAFELNYYTLNLPSELDSMNNQYILRDGAIATLNTTNTKDNRTWYFFNNKWIEKNNVISVNNMKEQDLLTVARIGDFVEIENTDDRFVYSGQNWIPINNEYQLSDINDSDELVAQEGDIASIFEHNGNVSGHFLYTDENWVSFVQAGSAGNIYIQSNNIALDNNGSIVTSTDGNGPGGSIDLISDTLILENGSSISSDSNSAKWGGKAGEISIDANDAIQIKSNASVTTSAENAGGGKIHTLAEKNLITLNGKIASSVKFGIGNGGDIELKAKNVLLNHSQVQANAEEGDGGAIFIKTDAYLKSADTLVEATSRRGNDGTVKVEAPKVDINKDLVNLPDQFMDATKWMKTPCEARSGKSISRFTVAGRESSPSTKDDLQADVIITYEYLKNNNKLSFTNDTNQYLFEKGHDSFLQGQFEKAANNFQSLLSVSDINDHIYLMVLEYLACIYQSKGFVNNALNVLLKGSTLVEQIDDIHQKSLYYSRMGDIYLSMGDMTQSTLYLKKATQDINQLTDHYVLVNIMNHVANAMAVDERYLGAMHIYDKCLSLLDDSTINAGLKGKILLNIAYALSFAGNTRETLSAIKSADSFLSTSPDTYAKATSLISLSLIILEVKDLFPNEKLELTQMAFKHLHKACQIGKKIHNTRVQSEAYANIGLMYEINGQLDAAITQTRKAIFLAHQGNYPEILYLWQWQAGRIHKAMGHHQKAIHSYQSAIQTLDPIRKELFLGYRYKTNIFQQEIKPVYQELAELYLDQADLLLKDSHSNISKQNVKDLQRKLISARDVMEQLKTAELQDYFEDECVVNRHKKPAQMNFMPDGVALVYPIPLADRLVILLTLSDGIKHFNIDIDAASMENTARTFRRQLQTVISNEFLTNAQKMYNWLIRPLLTELQSKQIHTLVVAPDGVLRTFPFSALHDGQSFLIENYAIATIPAISLTDPEAFERKDISVLLGGLSHAVQDFSPLPSVKKELKDIQTITHSNNVLFNKEYTKDRLTNTFQENAFDIVHLATHGVFAGTARDSFLLTYDDKLNMNMLEDLMSQSKYKKHQVDLLTLSACQTALGNDRSALGLAGVAIKSGVRSAIGTLWYVDDESTSIVIREMYRLLKQSDYSKVKALQKAQQSLITQSKYWHPVFWAPFLLIGNWI
jgi:filamentous hemagglutinin family protein